MNSVFCKGTLSSILYKACLLPVSSPRLFHAEWFFCLGVAWIFLTPVRCGCASRVRPCMPTHLMAQTHGPPLHPSLLYPPFRHPQLGLPLLIYSSIVQYS